MPSGSPSSREESGSPSSFPSSIAAGRSALRSSSQSRCGRAVVATGKMSTWYSLTSMIRPFIPGTISRICRRPSRDDRTRWSVQKGPVARRAMTYAGFEGWQPGSEEYAHPDDGMRQFLDCDLWLVISDRLPLPLLPIRPYILLVHDYLQRYPPHDPELPESSFLRGGPSCRAGAGDDEVYGGRRAAVCRHRPEEGHSRAHAGTPVRDGSGRSALREASVFCLADKCRRAQEPRQFVQGAEDLLGGDRRKSRLPRDRRQYGRSSR